MVALTSANRRSLRCSSSPASRHGRWTQKALRADPERAAGVGRKLFPPSEAALIAELIRRDLPYYDATITPEFVAGMNQFARDIGILEGNPRYEDVVATQFQGLWK